MKNSYEKITGDDFSGEKYDNGQPVEDVVDGGGRERQPELVPVADLYSDVKKLKLLCYSQLCILTKFQVVYQNRVKGRKGP